MNVADLKKTCEQKMQKSIDSLKNNLAKIRTGRAHAGMLDQIHVDYYGSPTALTAVASMNVADARTIIVQPFERKMTSVIEKAIRDSDLGLNPSTTGDVVRVPMPSLTEERRREMAKLVKGEGEDAKVAVRNIRRDANNQLKDALKAKTLPEDAEKKAQDDVQKMTDKFVLEIDKLVHDKEKELMSV
ncbi:MAG: ribosome recycling factor [Rhodocyclaceae bacterium]|jgi:ribosome recycling factor|nr:ribosome recycling factor [Rhodocyclaceae bacterium]MCE2722159.1 ribosome recycling factor [Betaproteobacteria bacterium]MCA3002340.1 ribosome recycling factor [Rhodocyclaceae bacterium]MCA3022868.1 ribosome recycling factor [Rhodocyclaceae bacterium]MCA3028311.1 ribosome recycling factor [Rhodocyclaceae bacterium]